jgi:cell division septation protein DedD
MLRNDDNETEILLGNKQLLGIFFVVAILLGVAFYGGYMVGKTVPARKAIATVPPAETSPVSNTTATGSGGETHTLSADNPPSSASNPTDATEPPPETTGSSEPPLGTPKAKARPASAPTSQAQEEPAHVAAQTAPGTFAPEPGEEFLQVAAVGRDEALGVANVLHAKGFRAHAVPKPGNPKIYRVLIGPLRDAGDLSTTRDALRKTGFREVIVQKY